MTRFNLSEWAVNNKAIVVFFMLLCAVAGVGAYDRLGRQEDPDFSVQTMGTTEKSHHQIDRLAVWRA